MNNNEKRRDMVCMNDQMIMTRWRDVSVGGRRHREWWWNDGIATTWHSSHSRLLRHGTLGECHDVAYGCSLKLK